MTGNGPRPDEGIRDGHRRDGHRRDGHRRDDPRRARQNRDGSHRLTEKHGNEGHTAVGARYRPGFVWLAVFAGIVAAATVGALGTPSAGEDELARQVVSGVVRRVGSEPLTQIVVTGEGSDYIVPSGMASLFEKHLGRSVTVEAGIRTEELETVDGAYTVTRRYLVEPVILDEQ